MKFRPLLIYVAIAGALITSWYLVEPYAVTFVDDGPYYSSHYSQPVAQLPINSKAELRRFGRLAYILESRNLADEDGSVLVLRDPKGSVLWTRKPLKPDGELGRLELRRVHMTWNCGWRIRIEPGNQEGGYLYLGSYGGFRFFNHSW